MKRKIVIEKNKQKKNYAILSTEDYTRSICVHFIFLIMMKFFLLFFHSMAIYKYIELTHDDNDDDGII